VVGIAMAREVSPLARKLKMPEIELAWQKVQSSQGVSTADRRGQRRAQPATFELIRYFRDIEKMDDLSADMAVRVAEMLQLLRALEREAGLSDDPGMRRVIRAVQRSCDSCHEAAGLKKN
jgi:cytochrome c556